MCYKYGTMQLAESNLGEDYLASVLAQHQPSWSCEVLLAVPFKTSKNPSYLPANEKFMPLKHHF